MVASTVAAGAVQAEPASGCVCACACVQGHCPVEGARRGPR